MGLLECLTQAIALYEMNLQRKVLFSILRFKQHSVSLKFNTDLFKQLREQRLRRNYFRSFYRQVRQKKMKTCFNQEAKAHLIRQRLFLVYRSWKKVAKVKAKESIQFIKRFKSSCNSALCLRFLAIKTGLWNLMDLYAFFVQKKRIVRLKPFSNAFQHAIKEQLR